MTEGASPNVRMNGRVCSILSVATVLPSTFSPPIRPLADSAIVTEHFRPSSQTVIFEVKLELALARCQLRSLPTTRLKSTRFQANTGLQGTCVHLGYQHPPPLVRARGQHLRRLRMSSQELR